MVGRTTYFNLSLVLAASFVTAGKGSTCLPDGIPPESRVNIVVNGISMPLSVWKLNWGSAISVSRIYRILAEEVLGYNTTDVAGSGSVASGLVAMAGCENPDWNNADSCQPFQPINHHIMMEGWPGAVDTAFRFLKFFKGYKPVKAGPVGYASSEGIYISSSMQNKGLQAKQDLTYYKFYNASWHNPKMFFDNYTLVDRNRLKTCNTSRFGSSTGMSTYLKASGDIGGVVNISGQISARCGDDRWWFSPVCRSDPDTCLPLLTAGDGWGVEFIMQQATAHNFPLAMAVAATFGDYIYYAQTYRFLAYWWVPDDSLLAINPLPVVFPDYDSWEWDNGIYSTSSASVPLNMCYFQQLPTVAFRAYSLLNSFEITLAQLQVIFQDAAGDFEGAACRWVRNNTAIWSSWIAGATTCSPGQGMKDAQGNFVTNRSLATNCRFCPAGYYSKVISDSVGTTYICEMCQAGTAQSTPESMACVPCRPGTVAGAGMLQCTECRAGMFANESGLSSCYSCPAGTVSSLVGSMSCQLCEAGTYSDAPGSSICTRCSSTSFAPTAGLVTCLPCQDGRTDWLEWTADDRRTDCQVDSNVYWTFWPGTVLLTLGFAEILLAVHFDRKSKWGITGRHFHIMDVSTLMGGQTVAELSSNHCLRTRSYQQSQDGWRSGTRNLGASFFTYVLGRLLKRRLRVTFGGTGHPALDSPDPRHPKVFLAEVAGSRHLKLYTSDGSAVKARYDSSMGYLVPSALEMFLHWGWPLPSGLQSLLLIIGSILVSYFASVKKFGACLQVLISLILAFTIRSLSFCWRGRTWLEIALAHYSARLKARNPHPIATPPGASRAFRIEHFVELFDFFCSLIKDRNMYYLDSHILRPITKPYQLSFAEVVGPQPVQWFVSHFWGTSLAYTVKSLRKHAEAVSGKNWGNETYWICTLSNNQYNIDAELGGINWQQSSFYITLRSGLCRGVCMVLTEEAWSLTRSWCLFELLQTIELVEEKTFPNFGGLLFCTDTGVLNEGAASVEISMGIGNRLATLRLQDAQASRQEDKDMIDGLVQAEMGGFDVMNAKLREKIAEAIAEAQKKCNMDFNRLKSRLVSDGIHVDFDADFYKLLDEETNEYTRGFLGNGPMDESRL